MTADMNKNTQKQCIVLTATTDNKTEFLLKWSE